MLLKKCPAGRKPRPRLLRRDRGGTALRSSGRAAWYRLVGAQPSLAGARAAPRCATAEPRSPRRGDADRGGPGAVRRGSRCSRPARARRASRPAHGSRRDGLHRGRLRRVGGPLRRAAPSATAFTRESLGVPAEATQKIEKIYVPTKSKKTEFLTGTPKEIATKLVEKLKFEARVI